MIEPMNYPLRAALILTLTFGTEPPLISDMYPGHRMECIENTV